MAHIAKPFVVITGLANAAPLARVKRMVEKLPGLCSPTINGRWSVVNSVP